MHAVPGCAVRRIGDRGCRGSWESAKQYFSSEEDAAEYYQEVLPRLVRVGALGAFAWCFADYDEGLFDKPPCDRFVHERTFGCFGGWVGQTGGAG